MLSHFHLLPAAQLSPLDCPLQLGPLPWYPVPLLPSCWQELLFFVVHSHEQVHGLAGGQYEQLECALPPRASAPTSILLLGQKLRPEYS